MILLKIIGIIVLIFLLISLISVGIAFNYEDRKLTLSAYICGLLVQLIPKKNKTEKSKKEKPKKEESSKEEKKKNSKEKKPRKPSKEKKKKMGLALSFEEILEIIKKVFRGIGKFTHGWNVSRFMLHYVAAGDDPYDTARIFGYVNIALSSLAPICSERFNCKDTDVRTDIDFSTDKTLFELGLTAYFRLGSIFAMVNTIIFGTLHILIKNKCRLLWLKLTDREAYREFEEEQIAKKERMTELLSKLKAKKSSEEKDTAAPETAENISTDEIQKENTDLEHNDL